MITDEMVEIALTIIFGPPAPPGSNSLTREFNRPSVRRTIEAIAPMLVPDTSANIINWLRRNANAEQDPAKRAAFIEAHNAARVIVQTPPNTTRPDVATDGE